VDTVGNGEMVRAEGTRLMDPFSLSLSLVFVQGDPFCAQRTDGDVGFLLLWLATEGC
jgi:hypothetical protein